ncbi:MAG: CocE/NonD family hydrolase [Hyphomicrobiales bacterium]|nr:CocE/NonD family hydrolase [Hyphomicrobiales bacterium]
MRIEWDVPITMDDGVVLRADVFRPIADGKYPAILSYGPYGKGLAFQDGFKAAWDKMVKDYPETTRGTSSKYAVFEVVDPEKWVPDGYVCVRIDCRGAGRSPGYMDLKSVRETKDLYDCIEWAAAQPWCTGKVGLNGISYYATNQWYVASLQPPHLAAICVWEGAGDYYRENTHHGGILCNFFVSMYPWAVYRLQHGMGERGPRSRATGELAGGPETLPEEGLIRNRLDVERSLLSHPLDDAYYRGRSAVWSKITVPVLTAANWGGHGLHTRGNFEGYVRAASSQKWLEAHGDTHWSHFYTDYGVALQKRFLGHFLKGEDTGWDKQSRVQLQVRHPDRFVERHESEWPLARTQWTRFYLEPSGRSLQTSPSTTRSELIYDPSGDGVTFLSPPLAAETEITGPVAAKLFVSSASSDADLFLVLRAFAPDGQEVLFQGSNDPHTPIALGWLRASHRKLDEELTLPYRPYHSHDEIQPLSPGAPVALDIEIWPTSIVLPAGYRIGLSVRGKDYHYGGPPVVTAGSKFEQTGVGPFVHNNVKDRPPEIFGAPVTLHFGPEQQPYVLLPVIPAK